MKERGYPVIGYQVIFGIKGNTQLRISTTFESKNTFYQYFTKSLQQKLRIIAKRKIPNKIHHLICETSYIYYHHNTTTNSPSELQEIVKHLELITDIDTDPTPPKPRKKEYTPREIDDAIDSLTNPHISHLEKASQPI